MDLDPPRTCSLKLITYLEINKVYLWKRSSTVSRLSSFYKQSSRKKHHRFLDSLSSSETEPRVLRLSLISQLIKRELPLDLTCSSRYCSSFATKTRSFKVMRKVISKAFSWGRPVKQRSLKLYLIKTTLSLLSKSLSSISTGLTPTLLVVYHQWRQTLTLLGIISSTRCSLFNMSVSRQS